MFFSIVSRAPLHSIATQACCVEKKIQLDFFLKTAIQVPFMKFFFFWLRAFTKMKILFFVV
jgi:hypothetical protein